MSHSATVVYFPRNGRYNKLTPKKLVLVLYEIQSFQFKNRECLHPNGMKI